MIPQIETYHIQEYTNDVWKFDGNSWSWVIGSNVTNQIGNFVNPGARHGAAYCTNPFYNTLVMFGGYGYDTTQSPSGGYLNDMWTFNGVYWTWISGSNLNNQIGYYGVKGVASASNVPGARSLARMWMDFDNKIWLFGGNVYGAGKRLSLTYISKET